EIEKFSQSPDFVRFLFENVSVDGADPRICRAAHDRLQTVEPWEASRLEDALRALADELGEKPRTAFQPIRLAVTGSKVSPGLFESLELLGRDVSLARLGTAAAAATAWTPRRTRSPRATRRPSRTGPRSPAPRGRRPPPAGTR